MSKPTVNRLLRALAATVVIALPAGSASAAQLTSTNVSSSTSAARACHERLASSSARGVDQKRVTMPAAGLVSARLTAGSGDWDLGVFDARSGRSVAGSAGFNSSELAEGFADGDRELVVQACRLFGSSRSARLSVAAFPLPTNTSAEEVQLVRVNTPTQASKDLLTASGLDLTEHGGADFVEVVLHGADDADLLRQGGFGFDVRIDDLTERNRQNAVTDAAFAKRTRASALPSGRDNYRRLADYELELKQLAQQHPGLVRPFTLPNKTREGREVYGIEVTKGPHAGDSRPAFFNMGVHHAREWPSGEHSIEFAYDLVTGYGSDDRITDLVNRTRTIFVPIVNVDGFNLSREAAYDMREIVGPETGNGYSVMSLTDPFFAYKRRNCGFLNQSPPRGACGSLPARHQGVDPNRNYGALWGGPGASAFPHEDTYRGPGPFSEPETQNIRDVVSKNQVTTLITNHTFSNLILRPPGVRAQGQPPDEAVFNDLGARMAEQNGYTNQPGYALYDTTGTTEDWSYAATAGLGYTFEIGPTEFHPPYEEMIGEYNGKAKTPYEGKGNRAAYLLALENTADASKHSVLEGEAQPGSVVRLHKEFQTETSPVRRAQAWLFDDPTPEGERQTFTDTLDTTIEVGDSGRFEWHVNPSTRPGVAGRVLPTVSEQPSRTQKFDNAEPSSPGDHKDFPFTVEDADGAKLLRVATEWKTPDDYDLEVYRKQNGELVKVGSSGNPPAQTEEFFLENPKSGEYVARVINFAALNPSYTVTADLFAAGPDKIEAGTTESWTLSCETADGKVLATQKVTIARGEKQTIDACKPGAAGVPQALKAGRCANSKRGSDRSEKLRGTTAGDKIWGRGGRDRISGMQGDDCLSGGASSDRLIGGSGNDRLVGGSGKNAYSGGPGNDTVLAANGSRERIVCGSGRRDRVVADRGDRVSRSCERVRRK